MGWSDMDRDADGYGRGCRRISKIFVGILLVIFVWLMFIGTLDSRNSDGLATSTSSQNLKHVVVVEITKHYVPANADPVYTSKRRVPSGPDPIHNRHIGETKRPPGRV
ncbi:hypothetical protein RND81_10G075700 [Saponaria officinalis]|uniref:CLAVATA3/ESR (CLE)-related protein 25 n=1 Tax=Saponaria officinalis TaxID=3572 RepID=A0AAW1I1H7_SAPOF